MRLRPRISGRRAGALSTLPVVLLLAGSTVWHSTSALFTVSTGNTGSAFTAGSVAISDDDGGTALFTVPGLQRGAAGANCVVVSYTGTIAASVRLFVSASSGSLAQHLTLTVQEGSGGAFGNCTGFSASSTIYSGTLAAFASASSDWPTGAGTWAPTGSGQTRTYHIAYVLSASAPISAQNTSAAATFTWEARAT